METPAKHVLTPDGKHFPACHVVLPDGLGRQRAPFYLATEEYLAAAFPEDHYFFSWVLNPTVVMGRNQVARHEVDLDFCQAEGIDVVRRRSGGGCIYADGGNIMFSLVTGESAVEPLFAEYAHAVAQSLTAIDAPASVSGRNDIILDGGGKICGNAFYHQAHRNIVHGTMLYDTDYRRMLGALHPDEAKLTAQGVKSVRSRVSLIKDVLPIGVEALRFKLVSMLTDRELHLTDEDVARIRQIEAAYYAPEWLDADEGLPTEAIALQSGRIEGMGKLTLHLEVRNQHIAGVRLSGDFFPLADAEAAFAAALVHVPAGRAEVLEALAQHHPETSIRGLTAEVLQRFVADGWPQ